MDNEVESFLRWAASIGVSDSDIAADSKRDSYLGHTLSVSYFAEAGGRGLAAKRLIKKGDLVLSVPKEAMITRDCLISKDCHLSDGLVMHPLLSSSQILSVTLLNEVSKGRKSPYHPYLKQLPRSYDLLSHFDRLEISALQIDDAIWTAEKAVEKCKTEWREALPLISDLNLKPHLTTFKAWLWASATISSRTMHIPWDTAGCLCPVGDFFNYTPPEEEDQRGLKITERSKEKTSDSNLDMLVDACYDESVASYCFYANRNYQQGDQVLLSYGTYTNLELLDYYGFILGENPNDKAYIPLEPEMYSLCSWPKESLYIAYDGEPSFALISTVRLWAVPASERTRSIKHAAYSGQRISVENEVLAMEWITSKCRGSLGSCATSIEEDGALLDIIDSVRDSNSVPCECGGALRDEIYGFFGDRNGGGEEFPEVKRKRSVVRWRLAVQWRLMYKRILSDCISRCNKILADHSG